MSMNKPTVLIAENEIPVREFLRAALEAENLKVAEAEDGRGVIAAANGYRPDIYILALGAQDKHGIELIGELRAATRNPIIVVTARHQESENVKALDAGADDCLTKPIGAEDLKGRVRAALRRLAWPAAAADAPVLFLGDIKIDLEGRRVARGQEEIHLTPSEFKLLEILAKRPGKLITQRSLLLDLWGPSFENETHYLRVYMKQLRDKLEPDPSAPRYIIAEMGVGYRLLLD